MIITKEILNQEKFKITESGTFTIDQKDVIASERFQYLINHLKPVNELRK